MPTTPLLHFFLLLLLPPRHVLANGAAPRALTDEELRYAYMPPMYRQPAFDRRSKLAQQELLQRAATLRQDGELGRAVEEYKAAIKKDPRDAEAYASLSRCLDDQGKHELADKAMAKATRLQNEAAAKWSLF